MTESLEPRALLAVLPSVILGTASPGAPPAPDLEGGSDTGSSDSDNLTRTNLAPVFDIGTVASPVDGGVTVQLFRTPLDASEDAAGPAVLVNTVSNVNGGIVPIADINHGQGTIADGTYLYTALVIDAAGHVGPISPGLEVTIDATAPAAPPQPVLVNDTGTSSDDTVTAANNSASSPDLPNAPVFSVAGVEPHATVVLVRNGLEIARMGVTTGGTVTITDLNGGSLPGQAPIADGIYLYKVRQIDEAGNTSQSSGDLTITIDRTAPLASSPPVLEPASDTSDGLAHTTKNNGPGPQDAPVFDVASVEPGAGVILYRAPVVGGVVGTFVRVNALPATAGGTVAIADINQTDPRLVIPGPEIPDGTYLYQALQVDLAGNLGPRSASSATIIIDTTSPVVPPAPRLDPASDTGFSHDDAITQITLTGSPIFDISGIEGNALVRLYRLAPGGGASTLVGSMIAPASSTPVEVRITDVSESTPDGTYIYTAQQIDQAGNVSAFSLGIPVTYDTSQPPTPGAAALDSASQAGGGDPSTTSDRTPAFQIKVTVPGAKNHSSLVLLRDGLIVNQGPYDLSTGTLTITDPGPVGDGVHTYQTFLIDPAGNRSEISAGVAITFAPDVPGTPALDPASDSGTQGDRITNLAVNLSFIVSVATPGDTVQLYRDGQLVGMRNGPGPVADTGPALADGTYLYTVRQVDEFGTTSAASAPLSVTIVTRVDAPTEIRLSPSSDSGTRGDQITNITGDLSLDVLGIAPGATVVLLRDGVAVGRPTTSVGGKVTIVDPGPLSPGTYQYAAAQIDGAGNVSAASLPVSLQIVTTGTAPTLALDPASDSGKADGITRVNGSGGIFPRLIVANVTSGATLNLLRNGVIVQTLFDAPAGSVVLTDFNGGSSQDPGPLISDGAYQYTVQQIDTNGNRATSTVVTARIVTSAAAPGSPTLLTGSDTGAIGDNVTSARSPAFNVSGVPSGGTLGLLRDGVAVNTISDVPGGTVAIGDPGPLLGGRHVYSAIVTDGAGNVSPAGAPLVLSVVSVQGDYDGDGKADPAVYRRISPTSAQWFISGGDGASGSPSFGSGALDVPFQGDVDGDGMTDLILYRPGTSQWFVQQSSRGFAQYAFGGAGDLPAVGDFDGLGHDQLAVYRPSTGQWFVAGHGDVYDTFGGPSDVPVPLRNYYGTGRDALAVYRGSTSEWFVAGQGTGISFGGVGDLPVPLYNIYGDGRAVLGVFRPSTSTWYVGGQGTGTSFGGTGDVAVALDFDGLGHDELAVYRPGTGEWFVAGHGEALVHFGGASDIPVGSPYAYRALEGSPLAARGGSTVSALGLGPVGSSEAPGSGQGTAPSPSASSVEVIQASTSNSARPVASPPATQTSTESKRPNQTLKSSRGHIHDLALASLKGFGKRARAKRFLGLAD